MSDLLDSPLDGVLEGAPERRIEALYALLDRDPLPELNVPFGRCLKDESARLRAATLDVIGRLLTFRNLRVSQALIEQIERLTEDESPPVRTEAAATLAQLPEDRPLKKTRAALLSLLQDPHPRVVQEAAAALGDLKVTEATEPLIALLNDSDEQTRFEAAFALASLKNARALPVLVKALEERKRRLDACEALKRLGAKEAIEPLRKHTSKFFLPWVDRLTLHATLHILGDGEAGAKVVERSAARNKEERTYALALIGSHKIKEGFDRLLEVARNPKDKLRDTAVRALGELGDDRAADALRELIADPSGSDELAEDAKAALAALAAKPKPGYLP